jgi:hypothetical protein
VPVADQKFSQINAYGFGPLLDRIHSR